MMQTQSNDAAFGCLLNFLGSILINIGSNFVKLSHTRELKHKQLQFERQMRFEINFAHVADTDESEGTTGRCTLDWLAWFSGSTMFILGNLCNFISLSLAPQSLLAPLGCVQFLTNVLFARIVLKKKITWTVIFGTGILIIGICLNVLSANNSIPENAHTLSELQRFFTKEAYIIYISSLVVILIITWISTYLTKTTATPHTKAQHSKREGVQYAIVSAIVGAQSVTFFKILAELSSDLISIENEQNEARKTRNLVFCCGVLLLAVVSCTFWVYRLNRALRLFDALFIIPVFQVFWITISTIGGGIYFQEFLDLSKTEIIFLSCGVMVEFIGVYFITYTKPNKYNPNQFTQPLLSSSSPVATHSHTLHQNTIQNTNTNTIQNTNINAIQNTNANAIQNTIQEESEDTTIQSVQSCMPTSGNIFPSILSSSETVRKIKNKEMKIKNKINKLGFSFGMPIIDAVHYEMMQQEGLKRSDTL